MKLLSIFFCVLICPGSFGQHHVLFKIITLSYGVSIDGNAIAVGDDVTAESQMIKIPKDGYLGVITRDGYLYELTNSIAVANVESFVANNRSIIAGTTRALSIPSASSTNSIPVMSYDLSGDSLFLIWDEDRLEDQVKGKEYEIKITSAEDELLIKSKIKNNWLVLDVKPFFADIDAIVVSIRLKERSFGEHHISKRNQANQKLANDLERLGSRKNLAMVCAVYDINKFHYDRNFVVYKIITQDYKTWGVLDTYTSSLRKQVNLR